MVIVNDEDEEKYDDEFHDWYLRVLPTSIDLVQACFSTGTFGSLAEKIVFDFNDMQTCFHLRAIEMNLIHTWCL